MSALAAAMQQMRFTGTSSEGWWAGCRKGAGGSALAMAFGTCELIPLEVVGALSATGK
jgi:hypothetical protein